MCSFHPEKVWGRGSEHVGDLFEHLFNFRHDFLASGFFFRNALAASCRPHETLAMAVLMGSQLLAARSCSGSCPEANTLPNFCSPLEFWFLQSTYSIKFVEGNPLDCAFNADPQCSPRMCRASSIGCGCVNGWVEVRDLGHSAPRFGKMVRGESAMILGFEALSPGDSLWHHLLGICPKRGCMMRRSLGPGHHGAEGRGFAYGVAWESTGCPSRSYSCHQDANLFGKPRMRIPSMACSGYAISVGADGSIASWYVKREDDEMVLGGRFPGGDGGALLSLAAQFQARLPRRTSRRGRSYQTQGTPSGFWSSLGIRLEHHQCSVAGPSVCFQSTRLVKTWRIQVQHLEMLLDFLVEWVKPHCELTEPLVAALWNLAMSESAGSSCDFGTPLLRISKAWIGKAWEAPPLSKDEKQERLVTTLLAQLQDGGAKPKTEFAAILLVSFRDIAEGPYRPDRDDQSDDQSDFNGILQDG
eukprot:s582_g19.t3